MLETNGNEVVSEASTEDEEDVEVVNPNFVNQTIFTSALTI